MAEEKATKTAPKKAEKTEKKSAPKAEPKSTKKPANKTSKKAVKGPKSTFSVIKTGGKQYIVSSGYIVKIEAIKGKKEGDKVTFDQVFMTVDGDKISVGTPTVSGAKVEGEIVESALDKKIDVIRYRAKSRHFKKKGHRQPFMKVEIK